MSSIIPHDGFDSDSDSDDEHVFNPDHVEQHYHHDDNDVHSNDPNDENDEFPTPDEWPILYERYGWPVLRDTEVAGSLRRETTHEKQPSAPRDWDIPSPSPSESPRDFERELEELRTEFRMSLLAKQHEKPYENANPDQPSSSVMSLDTRGQQNEKQDNTPGGSFSIHEKQSAQAASHEKHHEPAHPGQPSSSVMSLDTRGR